jgi:hypothetical protein
MNASTATIITMFDMNVVIVDIHDSTPIAFPFPCTGQGRYLGVVHNFITYFKIMHLCSSLHVVSPQTNKKKNKKKYLFCISSSILTCLKFS